MLQTLCICQLLGPNLECRSRLLSATSALRSASSGLSMAMFISASRFPVDVERSRKVIQPHPAGRKSLEPWPISKCRRGATPGHSTCSATSTTLATSLGVRSLHEYLSHTHDEFQLDFECSTSAFPRIPLAALGR